MPGAEIAMRGRGKFSGDCGLQSTSTSPYQFLTASEVNQAFIQQILPDLAGDNTLEQIVEAKDIEYEAP